VLRLAGVLEGGTEPPTYTVQLGDSLFRIAESQLGDSSRWPEIHDLNRDILPNPDRIFPGQVLILPR
jgi:nucleoid-associated protein YgaU